jgi:predicted metal-dependent phosphoesterase TrpH
VKINRLSQILLCVALASATVHADRAPNLVLRGTLTRTDHETYRMLPFTVPSGVHRITVKFSYTGQEHHTAIDLGLFGPRGFRGWSGGNKSSFTVSANDATPSYLKGAITPGVWKVALGVPNIRADIRSEYTVNIFFDLKSLPDSSSFAFSPPLKTGPAWYRGDLHTHTGHSDGHCNSQSGKEVPCPVFKTLEAAAARKLDFIAVSDHNTVSHFNDLRELAPYFDNLLLLHAREITTFQGHANVFGTDQFIDFRVSSPNVPDINTMLRQAHELGGLVSINHPEAPSGEDCMGCGWNPHPEADMQLVTAVEAVNGVHPEIEFWQKQLNRGYRLTGIGGSDSHDAGNRPPESSTVGTPTTVLYAKELSETAILDGIRAGHVFIDLEGTSDRMLSFQAIAGAQSAEMGDTIHVSPGTQIKFSVQTVGVPNQKLEPIEDGKPLFNTTLENGVFSIRADDHRHWFRINVWSSKGKLLLVGNPIYVNF